MLNARRSTEVSAPLARRPLRRVLWVLRIVLVAAGLATAAWAIASYTTAVLPGTGGSSPISPLNGDFRKGDRLLLVRMNMGREPRLGDVVIYSPEGRNGASFIGRIQGLPGESMTRMGPTFSIGGREPLGLGLGFGPEVKLREGETIPPGCCVILMDQDTEPYPDSRSLGFIALSDIDYRVAANLSALTGR
jgi:hypothetical protein